jgi:hypothetical protein
MTLWNWDGTYTQIGGGDLSPELPFILLFIIANKWEKIKGPPPHTIYKNYDKMDQRPKITKFLKRRQKSVRAWIRG